jgi:hypothetical protein
MHASEGGYWGFGRAEQNRTCGGCSTNLDRPANRFDVPQLARPAPILPRPCHDPAMLNPLAHRRRGVEWVLLRLGVERQASMRSGRARGRLV